MALAVTGVKRDYYEVLGVDRNADEAAIKRAYRALAMKYHPDRNPGDPEAVAKMKEINEAYAVLSDPHKRRLYDQYGHAGLEGYSPEDIVRGVDFSSLFREFGLRDLFGFGGLFDSLFGTGAARADVGRGADIRYDLTVTLEEVAVGVEKTVIVPVSGLCPVCEGAGAQAGGLAKCAACGGTGQFVKQQRSGYSLIQQIMVCPKCRGRKWVVEKPCQQCGGRGTVVKDREVKVRVPAGADTGYVIKLPGQGEKGRSGPGDLYVVLRVEKHPVFERHGDDLYVQHDIPMTTAALGGKVKVPGIRRTLELEIPEGTQTGTVFRIHGEGLPRLGGSGSGDEYVVVRVLTPTNLSHREKVLLKEFEKLRRQSQDK